MNNYEGAEPPEFYVYCLYKSQFVLFWGNLNLMFKTLLAAERTNGTAYSDCYYTVMGACSLNHFSRDLCMISDESRTTLRAGGT